MRDEAEICEFGDKCASIEEEEAEEREEEEGESEELVAVDCFGEVGERGCHMEKKGMFRSLSFCFKFLFPFFF